MKRYQDGGKTEIPLTKRMPAPQTDAELDKISPEARRMMEEKMRDMEQEKRQKKMEEAVKGKKYAKGGSVSKRADGCAQRGKTKGRMI